MAHSVTSAEFVRQFGQLRQDAKSGPVYITHHGRDTHVLVDIETYRGIGQDRAAGGTRKDLTALEQLGLQLPDGLLVCDVEERIIYANPTAAALLRRNIDNFQGQLIWDAIPEVVGSVVESHVRRTMQTGEPSRVDIPSLFRPGSWSHIECFPVGDGTGFMWRDITEQIRCQRLADVKKAIIAAMDLHGGMAYARLSVRGAIARASDGLLAMLKLPRERVLNVAMADLVPTGQRVGFRDALEGVLQGGAPARLDTAFLANDGKITHSDLVLVGLRGLYGVEGAVVVATSKGG